MQRGNEGSEVKRRWAVKGVEEERLSWHEMVRIDGASDEIVISGFPEERMRV